MCHLAILCIHVCPVSHPTQRYNFVTLPASINNTCGEFKHELRKRNNTQSVVKIHEKIKITPKWLLAGMVCGIGFATQAPSLFLNALWSLGASQFLLVWGMWFIAVWLGCCCPLLRLFDNNRFVGLPFFVLHASIWK